MRAAEPLTSWPCCSQYPCDPTIEIQFGNVVSNCFRPVSCLVSETEWLETMFPVGNSVSKLFPIVSSPTLETGKLYLDCRPGSRDRRWLPDDSRGPKFCKNAPMRYGALPVLQAVIQPILHLGFRHFLALLVYVKVRSHVPFG